MQLQGSLIPLSGTHVLVCDHDDHFYTLHYRHRPRPRADVPRHPHRDQKDGPLFRQGLVATQDPRRRRHHLRYHQIECTFPPFLYLVPYCGITRNLALSSQSSAMWFVHGEPRFYGSMIGEWSPSFPSAYLGPLVCALGYQLNQFD